jgi:hypothetical protein
MDVLGILAIVGNGTILLLVIELIRRGRLKERYSLLWLFAGVFLLILSLSGYPGVLSHRRDLLCPIRAVFAGFLFLLMITLYFR